jgi:uncharacterized membrane protein/protein-disulfide isomerase
MSNGNDIKLIEISEAAYRWLRALGNKVDKQFLKEEMFSHPDYPALTSLIDVLDAGNFDYTARKALFEERTEFNFPCIINISLSNGSKGLYYLRTIHELEYVKQQWGGIILYASAESRWQHPLNELRLKLNKQKTFAFGIIAIIIMAVSAAIALSAVAAAFSIWVLTAVAGLLICILLLAQELGLSTELVQKVCGIGGNTGGCSAVLNSKHAKGKFGISVATVAFAYFLCQWVLLLSSPYTAFAASVSESMMKAAGAGILIAVWSIYTQKFIIKSWCPLCLGLAGILNIQSGLAFGEYSSSFNRNGLLYFAIIFFVAMALAQSVKMLLEQVQAMRAQAQELNKWKRDTYMFLSQWKEQPQVDCSPLPNEIELSNPNGLLQITVACNPYCPPCAKAHETIDRLIDNYGESMSVKVRFVVNPDDAQNEKTKAVNLLLNAIEKHGAPKEMIHGWFESMDAALFAAQYDIKEIKHKQDILKQQDDWTTLADVQFTPTIFLNGRSLPKRYGINDIVPMLPEIYDQIEYNDLK